MTSVDEICAQLRERGYRLTPQRRAIIGALLQDRSHPTAEQVFVRVRESLPCISHATVYNTLHELVKIGTALELDLGLGERHYDINTGDHAHLVCLECGRVEDITYDGDCLRLAPEDSHGFQIVERCVILRGYCSVCAALRSEAE